MISNKINELLEEEIAKATIKKNEKIESLSNRLVECEQKNNSSQCKIQELNTEIENISTSDNVMSLVRPLLNESNIVQFLNTIYEEDSKVKMPSPDRDRPPVWFEAVTKFYREKDTVFKLLDFAGVKYPSWAKQFKMPYDYNEEELDIFFSDLHRYYVTNGNVFEHNIEYFWRDVRAGSGDTKKILGGKSYVAIPWNLLFRNELLVTDKFFDKILAALSNKYVGRAEYFLKLPKYQSLPTDKLEKLVDVMLRNSSIPNSKAVEILKSDETILKHNFEIARKLQDQMSTSEYSGLHYSKFPKHMQIEFVRGFKNVHIDTAIEVIDSLEIDMETKLELVQEVATKIFEQEKEWLTMAQVHFKNEEFHGILHFTITAMEYDEPYQQVELKINDFDDFVTHMHKFYSNNRHDLFHGLTVENLEFTGISFVGSRDGTERFSIDITNGWKRATTIFDEKKYGDLNKDKLKRIQDILRESRGR